MITKSTGKVFTSIAAAVRVPKLVKVRGLAAPPQLISHLQQSLNRTPHAQALDLTQSEDLRCRNVVCEKFDEPCLCRISRLASSQPTPTQTASSSCSRRAGDPCEIDVRAAACRVLERLESLESLSLAANDLTSLPPAVFALKQLRTLDISKNCLAEVQPDIAALESLQVRRHNSSCCDRAPLDF